MRTHCNIANLVAACRGLLRCVLPTLFFAACLLAFVWYMTWVPTQIPAFNKHPFAVFSVGHASATLRLEMLPAQILVGGFCVVMCGLVGWLCYNVLEDMCLYGSKLREADAAKRAEPGSAVS